MIKNFDYNGINLIPQKGIISRRGSAKTEVKFGKYSFKNPVIPANMISVINEKTAIKLSEENYFYIMHRFGVNNGEFVEEMKKRDLVSSISIGVKPDDYQYINNIFSGDLPIPDYITVDIAHGHSIMMTELLDYILFKIKDSDVDDVPFFIVGNISTIEAAKELLSYDFVKAVKVGIGSGSVCTTYDTTGFGSRKMQASTVYEISRFVRKKYKGEKYVIADGGIKTIGDMVKSYALGADMIMAGGILSNFNDDLENNIEIIDGVYYRKYFGSSSGYMPNKKDRIEGTIELKEIKSISIIDFYKEITQGFQSAISYSGGRTINDLRKVNFSLI